MITQNSTHHIIPTIELLYIIAGSESGFNVCLFVFKSSRMANCLQLLAVEGSYEGSKWMHRIANGAGISSNEEGQTSNWIRLPRQLSQISWVLV